MISLPFTEGEGVRHESRTPISKEHILRSTPNRSEDAEGTCKFFEQLSFPRGIGSHCIPETPGSIPKSDATLPEGF
jgi:XFP N-terminal domain